MAKGRDRRVLYLPDRVWTQLKVEAVRRKMTIGEIVEEALAARPVLTRHPRSDDGEKE